MSSTFPQSSIRNRWHYKATNTYLAWLSQLVETWGPSLLFIILWPIWVPLLPLAWFYRWRTRKEARRHTMLQLISSEVP